MEVTKFQAALNSYTANAGANGFKRKTTETGAWFSSRAEDK